MDPARFREVPRRAVRSPQSRQAVLGRRPAVVVAPAYASCRLPRCRRHPTTRIPRGDMPIETCVVHSSWTARRFLVRQLPAAYVTVRTTSHEGRDATIARNTLLATASSSAFPIRRTLMLALLTCFVTGESASAQAPALPPSRPDARQSGFAELHRQGRQPCRSRRTARAGNSVSASSPTTFSARNGR